MSWACLERAKRVPWACLERAISVPGTCHTSAAKGCNGRPESDLVTLSNVVFRPESDSYRDLKSNVRSYLMKKISVYITPNLDEMVLFAFLLISVYFGLIFFTTLSKDVYLAFSNEETTIISYNKL